jgi:hypothetical protein
MKQASDHLGTFAASKGVRGFVGASIAGFLVVKMVPKESVLARKLQKGQVYQNRNQKSLWHIHLVLRARVSETMPQEPPPYFNTEGKPVIGKQCRGFGSKMGQVSSWHPTTAMSSQVTSTCSLDI